MHMANHHPYAKMVLGRNNPQSHYGQVMKSRGMHPPVRQQSYQHTASGLTNSSPFDAASAPHLQHRASMPHVYPGGAAPDAVPKGSLGIAHLVSRPMQPQQRRPIARPSLPDMRYHSAPVRPVAAPIDGPLPAANFSFGTPSMPEEDPSVLSPVAASSSGLPQENGFSVDPSQPLSPSPDPRIYGYRNSLPTSDGGLDSEDASTSYDASTRFGSLLSNVSAASSATSAFYSDVEAPSEYDCASRRGS
jgi:hypothetical protein